MVKHTQHQDSEEDDHVHGHDLAPGRGGGDLAQEERRDDGEPAGAQAAPYAREEQQAGDAGGEGGDEKPRHPPGHEELPGAQAAEAVRQGEGEDGADGGAEDAEGGDVGLAVGQGRGAALPLVVGQAEVLEEGGEALGPGEATLVITCARRECEY